MFNQVQVSDFAFYYMEVHDCLIFRHCLHFNFHIRDLSYSIISNPPIIAQ